MANTYFEELKKNNEQKAQASSTVDPERAEKILDLCSDSLKELKTVKAQVSQLKKCMEGTDETQGGESGGSGTVSTPQQKTIGWMNAVEQTKRLGRIRRIFDIISSAIGKVEDLVMEMLQLTKGLRTGQTLGIGQSHGSAEGHQKDDIDDTK